MRKNKILHSSIVFFIICLLGLALVLPRNIYASEGKFNMTYMYFGSSNSYKTYVESTKNSLNEVSPSYFNLNNDGSLNINPIISMDLINEMHKNGIKVVPFLSNHWNRQVGINALNNRNELAQQIANAVKKYNLDGVNVDLENLTENERDIYTDFVKLLRSKLPSNKVIAVAVAANPNGFNKGWQGSYDYASLAKYSNYLVVMAYDEHYESGPEGPVAGAVFVDNSIKYALERVPASKIVLGIPFFGRYWKAGDSYGGYGISMAYAEKLIAKYNGKVIFDDEAYSPKAVITIKPNDEKPSISGRKLNTGTYTIWYENEESIKYKLRLVQKYNLKGTGSWSLGQETKNTWDYYSLWLNGRYFMDTEGHWAQEDIISVEQKGWIKGTSSAAFSPDSYLTRAQAAVILVRALGLEKEQGTTSFNDISNHWAKTEIEIAAQYGIVNGIGSGLFAPDETVTREQITTMIDRILFSQEELNDNTDSMYSDVNQIECSWSYNSILRLSQYGVITGYPDGNFRPAEQMTRAQMAALMNRISAYLENGSLDIQTDHNAVAMSY